MGPREPSHPHLIGRYALYGEIASGGMATVHYGRLTGPVGFSRTVAIKRLHPQFAKDPEFVSMFLDEARVAGRIQHPNVVQTLDVVALEGELFLVMDYVQGESLARLLRAAATRKQPVAPGVVSAIVCGALHGLHAAHEATNEQGEPLHTVHRDFTPQNVLVGTEGVARVLDFGVAKAAGRVQTTREGQLKGKLAYMAPEQLRGGAVDRRTDVFAAGIVLWEALTLRRLFRGDNEGAVLTAVFEQPIEAPSTLVGGLSPALDEVVLRALQRDPSRRFEGAREMALALEASVPVASPTRVAEWVQGLAGDVLAQRAKSVAQVESHSNSAPMPGGYPPGAPGAASSQISTISVSSSHGPGPIVAPDRRRRLVYTAVGAGVAVVALALLAFGRMRSAPGAPAVAPPAPSVLATASAAASDEPIASASPSASSASSESAAPVAPAPPAASVATRPSVRRTAPPPPPPTGAAAQPCVIKSYVDESGIQHFVKECK